MTQSNRRKLDLLDLIANDDEFYLLEVSEPQEIYNELIFPFFSTERVCVYVRRGGGRCGGVVVVLFKPNFNQRSMLFICK